ncbi:unnamed protein product [Cladocopium goreaui]|uniref:Uncharacterized protein n=1 Tax=Cladocopium goreaui TaxID=2562237 RepID=A0A9P1BQR1_9DINO|nr:unnamed protein product [Cladocopium goreaui]
MCRWWALAILFWHVSGEAPPVVEPSELASPEPSTFLAAAADTREAEAGSPSPPTSDDGEDEEARLRDKIAQEVEEKMKEHAEKKHEEEKEGEEAESDSTFLIFLVLGVAAVARFLCKGRVQREHSGYMIITDTSPTKKRETAAKFWASKRTQSLDSTGSSAVEKHKSNGSGTATGMPAPPLRPVPASPLRPGPKQAPEGKGALDLLFNAPKLAESLSHLGLRRRDGAQEVAPAARTTWWRQAIEPYRQTLGFTMEEAAVIDTPIAGLRGALGYDGSADWLRWANLAEQQMSSLRKDVEGGLVPVDPVDPVDGHDLRVVPQDGRVCRLDELCKKFNTSLSRFDAEQYFWSHCWPRKDTAAAASSFAFDGRWNYSSGSLQVTGGAVHWQSGLVTPINATSDLVFDMALDGEVFQGRLEDAGKRLVFSDGDVWTRQTPIQEHPPHDAGATTCQSTRPEQKVEVPEVEVEEDVEPMELDAKDVMSQEPPGGDQIVAAVSEVLFKAVAKADVETVRLGLQQVGLLGHEAVQSLLSIRDEGDSLLHLAAAGSRQSSDASSYVQIANTLLVARANVNDCNRSGATPWRLARKSDPVMEKLLLAFGADPDIGGDKSEVTLVKPFKAQLAQPGQSPEKVGTSEASTRPTRSSSLGSLALPEQRTDEESVEDHNPCQMPEEPPPGAKTTDWPLDLLRGECRSHKLPVSQGCTEAQLVERLAETMLTPGTKKGSLLAGVYIVDACLLPAGPFSAAALVSQGAQVLKIQPDSAGEATCEEATQLVQMQKCGDWQLLPQPLALDLRFAQNQRALDEILTKSQCLIHSFRANTAERVGLGKALKQRHPQLLVISISGQAKSAGSLFAYDAVVTQGSTMTQSSAVQHITPDVAAKMILQSLQNTENAGRHVRVSVMSAS